MVIDFIFVVIFLGVLFLIFKTSRDIKKETSSNIEDAELTNLVNMETRSDLLNQDLESQKKVGLSSENSLKEDVAIKGISRDNTVVSKIDIKKNKSKDLDFNNYISLTNSKNKKLLKFDLLNKFIIESPEFIFKIIESYFSGEIEGIKKYVSPEVYKDMLKSISLRKNEVHILNDIENIRIYSDSLESLSDIVLEFDAIQIFYILGENGEIIKGDDNTLITVKDKWKISISKAGFVLKSIG